MIQRKLPRLRKFMVPAGALLLCASLAIAQSVQPMPRIEGESLAGSKVVLPEAAKGKIAVLIFGFTRASKGPTSAWANKLNSEFGNQPEVVLYQLPVLEEVPRLIRGMVISGMKKGVRESMRDHFVPILQGEAELKKVVSYKDPDDAYLLLLNRSGEIVQQTHGSSPEPVYAQVQSEIQSLLKSPR